MVPLQTAVENRTRVRRKYPLLEAWRLFSAFISAIIYRPRLTGRFSELCLKRPPTTVAILKRVKRVAAEMLSKCLEITRWSLYL